MLKMRFLVFVVILTVVAFTDSGCSVMARQQQADAVRAVQKIVGGTWPNSPDVIKSQVFNADTVPTILVAVHDGAGSNYWLIYKVTKSGVVPSGPPVTIVDPNKYQIVGFLDGWVAVADDGVTISSVDMGDSFYRLEGRELALNKSGRTGNLIIKGGNPPIISMIGDSAADFEKEMNKLPH